MLLAKCFAGFRDLIDLLWPEAVIYYGSNVCCYRISNHPPVLCYAQKPGNETLWEVTLRAPEIWERWERVPSQFEILAATFG